MGTGSFGVLNEFVIGSDYFAGETITLEPNENFNNKLLEIKDRV